MFHTIQSPSLPPFWAPVDYLKGVSYLTFEGGKFSKSENRGIFAEDAIKEFPADYWRYWLMSNIPEASDTSFSFELFANIINKDLNGVLGNFVSRVLKMTSSKIGNEVPSGGEFGELEEKLIATLQTRVNDYIKYMNELEFRKAFAELRQIWVEGNNYISEAEPWVVIKEDEKKASQILRCCMNLIRIFAILSSPVMPDTSAKMLEKFGLKLEDMPLIKDFNVREQITSLKEGTPFEIGDMLFERITPERIEELKERYGSSK